MITDHSGTRKSLLSRDSDDNPAFRHDTQSKRVGVWKELQWSWPLEGDDKAFPFPKREPEMFIYYFSLADEKSETSSISFSVQHETQIKVWQGFEIVNAAHS